MARSQLALESSGTPSAQIAKARKDIDTALLLASTIATLGLIDDFGVLTPRAKVLGQMVTVFVLLRSDVMVKVAILPEWSRLLITVLWLVGLSNAFNLMDVMDGLAGGLGVIAAAIACSERR